MRLSSWNIHYFFLQWFCKMTLILTIMKKGLSLLLCFCMKRRSLCLNCDRNKGKTEMFHDNTKFPIALSRRRNDIYVYLPFSNWRHLRPTDWIIWQLLRILKPEPSRIYGHIFHLRAISRNLPPPWWIMITSANK